MHCAVAIVTHSSAVLLPAANDKSIKKAPRSKIGLKALI